MPLWMQFLAAILTFVFGLRLAAFFSGSETGFYRLSVPRLQIDARAGDRKANRILWFVNRPTHFVATCLLGNNLANYIATGAISSFLVLFYGDISDTMEVASTIIMAPIIFQFGELLPKRLFYLAPYTGVRKNITLLRVAHAVLFPMVWPLIAATKLFEKWSGHQEQSNDLLGGRNRIVQLMSQGKSEGVVSEVQSRLANGLMQLAPQTVTASMIPVQRILGLPDDTPRSEMAAFAKRFGVSAVSVHSAGNELDWYGYVTAAELALLPDETPKFHMMPVLPPQTSKLEALHHLQVTGTEFGIVKKGTAVLGLVSRNGLVEQIFRPDLSAIARATA